MNNSQFRLLVMLQIVTIFLVCVLFIPQLTKKGNVTSESSPSQLHDTIPVIQDSDLFFFGDSSATNKLYVFSAYDCGFCQNFYCENFTFLQKNYVEKGLLKIAFVPNGELESRRELFFNKISEIAKNENIYEEVQRELYCNKNLIDSVEIMKLLLSKGVDAEKLKLNLNDNELIAGLYKKRAVTRKYQVPSNPTFLLNGHILVGYNGKGDFASFFNKYFKN